MSPSSDDVSPSPRPPRQFAARRRRAGLPPALAALAAVLAGCRAAPVRAPRPAAEPDPPYELADDGDLAARRDELAAMAPGPERSALRIELAAALAERARGCARRGARSPAPAPTGRRR